jgi:hypothetical protein
MAIEKRYKVVDGTSYDERTSDEVIKILERSRKERFRLCLFYGDTETGKVWDDATPNRGHIGRGRGDIKIPLLIRTRKSEGGEGVLDHCIVKITESRGGKELYNLLAQKMLKDMNDAGLLNYDPSKDEAAARDAKEARAQGGYDNE